MKTKVSKISRKQPGVAPLASQKGVSLVITMVVLLVLTFVGIASTDSNRIQSALTRNSQFRLEAFNASYSEIDAQVDNINVNASIAAGVPPSIKPLIEAQFGMVDSISNPGVISVLANHPEMTQKVENTFAGKCLVIGSDINVGSKIRDCNVIKLDSDAAYKDTSIRSDQSQNYRYETFNAL